MRFVSRFIGCPWLAWSVALTAHFVATSTSAGPLASSPIPAAHAQPFQETIFGTHIDDPYRWMEASASKDELRAWIVSASDASVAALAALPERTEFARLVNEAMRAGTRYYGLTLAGDKQFYLRQDAADATYRLVVRESGRERVLLNPTGGAKDAMAIRAYSVSPDASMVAVPTFAGGAEVGEIHFIDVASGKDEGEPLGPVWGGFIPAWLGPRTIAYTRMAAPGAAADPTNDMRLFVTEIGAGPGTPVLGSGVADTPSLRPEEVPAIRKPVFSDYALADIGTAGAASRIFVTPSNALAAGHPQWRTIADYQDKVFSAALIGPDLYLLTTLDAPNGKVVRRSLDGRATTVLPESSLVLKQVGAARDGIYVSGERDGVSHLLFLRNGQGPAREAPLPPDTWLTDLDPDLDSSSVTFLLDGWTTNVAFYRAKGGVVAPLDLSSESWSGAKGVRAIREEATSADGTRVPMVTLVPAGWTGKPLPTILDGYGAYGDNNTTPDYSPPYLAWVAHGGAISWCGTRGGGERGQLWHGDGRGANRPKAQADFIACAQQLIATRKTSAKMLVATGTSAGGTLVPVAVMERPDLFAGLISRVAVVNATRIAMSENGARQFPEFGDPSTPSGFHALLGEDSYVMLGSAKVLPPTLVTIGLNDMRVSPWMGAKFAALARARFGADTPVLVRADAEAGHGTGTARDRQVAEMADTFAFAWAVTHAPER
jgi:prolyl oligopeptidase